jgi:HD-GYP domain-containing protein (c-di-GMP phosphodiesterase class II)
MGDTKVLLDKIATLRQRLDQVRGLVSDIDAASGAPAASHAAIPQSLRALQQKIAAGQQHSRWLDSSLRELAGEPDAGVLPTQLTARARRVIERGQELLGLLRSLAAEMGGTLETCPTSEAKTVSPDPLTGRFHETVAMAEAALRLVQTFPDAPSVQLRLCDGLEGILEVIADRIANLTAALEQRRQDTTALETLADLLLALAHGTPVTAEPFLHLAEEILAQARDAKPLRFLESDPGRPAQHIAAHSLIVAQVAARLPRLDGDVQHRPLEPILAALIHDAGMLKLPGELLAQAGPLTEEQRRAVESHPGLGAEMAARLFPGEARLAEATADHHERLDGTGYPAGLRGSQVGPLPRMLAVCDVYAALCMPRARRPAREPRTALADTLTLGEQGTLDSNFAERLLALSFYPVGSVVELADGAAGLVIATHRTRRDLSTPARPVLAVLTDAEGRTLPAPHHLDLAQCDGRSIVRALSTAERRALLGKRYPEYA